MKIIVLISAVFSGFVLVCQDLSHASKVVAPVTMEHADYEEPVATIALDTVVVVYKAPAPLAAK